MSEKEENQKITYTWQQMAKLHKIVAKQINHSSFKPDIIVGVMRCGIVSAVHLGYIIGIHNVKSIYAKTTPNDDILVEKNIPAIIDLYLPIEELQNKNILLVDTVMASGKTMKLCLDKLTQNHPSIIRTAIIVDWPNSPYKLTTGLRPKTNYVGCTADKWPEFPWEY